jgi:hypothetical protein
MNVTIFWDVISCCLIGIYKCSWGACWQLMLKVDTVDSYETYYRITCHIQENVNPYVHCHEDLKCSHLASCEP